MYKPADKAQTSFLDFKQPAGLHLNSVNRWVQMADKVPWDVFEAKYAGLFPSDTGNVAKPLRMALGSLIIQNRYQLSDRELVEQIMENPYYQYFIGLPGYQDKPAFDASTLVLFRKRITADMLNEANEYLLANKNEDREEPPSSGSGGDENASREEAPNKGTLTMDATCAPTNIRYPQEVSVLNEAREELEYMIYHMCKYYGLKLPRHYRQRARKDYLAFAQSRKHSQKQIHAAIKKQLSYVRRDIGCLEGYLRRNLVPEWIVSLRSQP